MKPELSTPRPASEAKLVTCRLYADEACTQEVLPDENGDYWLPASGSNAFLPSDPAKLHLDAPGR